MSTDIVERPEFGESLERIDCDMWWFFDSLRDGDEFNHSMANKYEILKLISKYGDYMRNPFHPKNELLASGGWSDDVIPHLRENNLLTEEEINEAIGSFIGMKGKKALEELPNCKTLGEQWALCDDIFIALKYKHLDEKLAKGILKELGYKDEFIENGIATS